MGQDLYACTADGYVHVCIIRLRCSSTANKQHIRIVSSNSAGPRPFNTQLYTMRIQVLSSRALPSPPAGYSSRAQAMVPSRFGKSETPGDVDAEEASSTLYQTIVLTMETRWDWYMTESWRPRVLMVRPSLVSTSLALTCQTDPSNALIYALSKFVAIPSVSSAREDCRQAAVWLKKCFSQLGADSWLVRLPSDFTSLHS
jgi:hypothetical protein